MTRKEVGLAVVSVVVLAASLYFMYVLLFSKSNDNTENVNRTPSTSTVVTGNIDSDTLEKIKTYKDYGEASLDNIGRVNPFGSLE